MTKQYIGDKEILTIEDINETTPIGSSMVKITFMDNTVKLYPKTLAINLQTTHPIDRTELRSKWIDPVVNQIMIIMQEADIRVDDLNYLLETLSSSIEHKSNVSTAKLFEVDHPAHRSMLQMERVIQNGKI